MQHELSTEEFYLLSFVFNDGSTGAINLENYNLNSCRILAHEGFMHERRAGSLQKKFCFTVTQLGVAVLDRSFSATVTEGLKGALEGPLLRLYRAFGKEQQEPPTLEWARDPQSIGNYVTACGRYRLVRRWHSELCLFDAVVLVAPYQWALVDSVLTFDEAKATVEKFNKEKTRD